MGAGEAKVVKNKREAGCTTTIPNPPPSVPKNPPPQESHLEEEEVGVGVGQQLRPPRFLLLVLLRQGLPPTQKGRVRSGSQAHVWLKGTQKCQMPLGTQARRHRPQTKCCTSR